MSTSGISPSLSFVLTQNDVVIDTSGCWNTVNGIENRNYNTLLQNFALYFQKEFEQAFVRDNDHDDWNKGRPDYIEVAAAQLVTSIENCEGRFVVVSDASTLQKDTQSSSNTSFRILNHQEALKKVTDDLVSTYKNMKLARIQASQGFLGLYVNQLGDGSSRSDLISTNHATKWDYTSSHHQNLNTQHCGDGSSKQETNLLNDLVMNQNQSMPHDRSQHHLLPPQGLATPFPRIFGGPFNGFPLSAQQPIANSAHISQFHANLKTTNYMPTSNLSQIPHRRVPFVGQLPNQIHCLPHNPLPTNQTHTTIQADHGQDPHYDLLQRSFQSSTTKLSSETTYPQSQQTSVNAPNDSLCSGEDVNQKQQPRKRKRSVKKLDLHSKSPNAARKIKSTILNESDYYDDTGRSSVHSELKNKQPLVELPETEDLYTIDATRPESMEGSTVTSLLGDNRTLERKSSKDFDLKSSKKKHKNDDLPQKKGSNKLLQKDEKHLYMIRLILAVLRKLVVGKSPIAAAKFLDLPLGHRPGTMFPINEIKFVLNPRGSPPDAATIEESAAFSVSSQLIRATTTDILDALQTEKRSDAMEHDTSTQMRSIIEAGMQDSRPNVISASDLIHSANKATLSDLDASKPDREASDESSLMLTAPSTSAHHGIPSNASQSNGMSAVVSDFALKDSSVFNISQVNTTQSDTSKGLYVKPELAGTLISDSHADSLSASTTAAACLSLTSDPLTESESKQLKVAESSASITKVDISKEIHSCTPKTLNLNDVDDTSLPRDKRSDRGTMCAESERQRSMRLLLRHRYLAAAENDVSFFEFSRNLLKKWGCHEEVNFVSNMEKSMKEEHSGTKNKKVLGRWSNAEQQMLPKTKSMLNKKMLRDVRSEDRVNKNSLRDQISTDLDTQNEFALVPSILNDDDNDSFHDFLEQDLKIDPNEHPHAPGELSVDMSCTTGNSRGRYWTADERRNFLKAWEMVGLTDWSSMSKFIPTRKRTQISGFGRYITKKLRLQRSDPPNTEAREFLLGHAAQVDSLGSRSEQSANPVSLGSKSLLQSNKGPLAKSSNLDVVKTQEYNKTYYREETVAEIDGLDMNIEDVPSIPDEALLALSIGNNMNPHSTADERNLAFDFSQENIM